MQYSELKQAIQDYAQNSETTFVSNIDNFIRSAEDKIFLSVQMPATRKSNVYYTVSGQPHYTLEPGVVDIRSIRIGESVETSSDYTGYEFPFPGPAGLEGWQGYNYGGSPTSYNPTVSTSSTLIFGDSGESQEDPTIEIGNVHHSQTVIPSIDADTYKYASMRIRQLTQPTGDWGMGWQGFFFWHVSGDINWLNDAYSNYPYSALRMSKRIPQPDWKLGWNEIVWDLTEESNWRGTVDALRFDFYDYRPSAGTTNPNAFTNAVWEIDWIRFKKPVNRGPIKYLYRKDPDFLLEAFPGTSSAAASGVPGFYSILNAGESFSKNPTVVDVNKGGSPTLSVEFAPVPDGVYPFVGDHYGKSIADSITYDIYSGTDEDGNSYGNADGNETWLSVTAPYVLLYGSLIEACTFMKSEPEMISHYQNLFQQGLADLKGMTEGRQKNDVYRTGEIRMGQR